MKLSYSSVTPERDTRGNIVGWRCYLMEVAEDGEVIGIAGETNVYPTMPEAYEAAKALVAVLIIPRRIIMRVAYSVSSGGCTQVYEGTVVRSRKFRSLVRFDAGWSAWVQNGYLTPLDNGRG